MFYPVFDKPLLSQDLYALSVTVITVSFTLQDALFHCQYLCMARLCQVLLEPPATGLSTSKLSAIASSTTTNHSLYPVFVEFLMQLRAQLVKVVNISCPVCSDSIPFAVLELPSGCDLYRIVYDSWLPFLQYITVLIHLLKSVAGVEKPLEFSFDLFEHLNILGLSSCLTNNAAVTATVDRWCNHFMTFYPNVSTSECNCNPRPCKYSWFIPTHTATAYSTETLKSEEVGDYDFDSSVSNNSSGGVKDYAAKLNEIVLKYHNLLESQQSYLSNVQNVVSDSVELVSAQDIWTVLQDLVLDLDITGIPSYFPCVDEDFGNMFSVAKQTNSSNWISNPSKPFPFKLSSVHTITPFNGSFTGTASVYGLHGSTAQHGYFDLSHFGLGLRHSGELIKLPRLYTDLYQQVFLYLMLCYTL